MLPMLFPNEHELRGKCADLQLYTLSDLTEIDNKGQLNWNIPEEVAAIRDYIPRLPPTEPPPLLVGQYWRLQQGIRKEHDALLINGDVIRIDGRLEDEILITRYRALHHSKKRHVLHIPGTIKIPTACLTHSNMIKRCALHQHDNDTFVVTNERLQHIPQWKLCSDPGPPQWIQDIRRTLDSILGNMQYQARPYTDGAYSTSADIESYFRPSELHCTATASIIIKDDSSLWRRKPVIALHISDGHELNPRSAYTMEFLALAGALQLTSIDERLLNTGSDAESIVELLPKRSAKLKNITKEHHYLLQCADNFLHREPKLPYSVESHAERRKPHKDAQGRYGHTWTKDDWGNWIADRIAAEDYDILTQHGINVIQFRIKATTMYELLLSHGQWYIGDRQGKPIPPAGLDGIAARQLATAYHQERDEYRIRDGREPTWEHNSTMEHAAEVYQLQSASSTKASTITRIIYNKGYHGGNRAKDSKLQPEEKIRTGQCLLCPHQDSQNHWLHHCSNRVLTKIREDIFANINRHLTDNRTNGPLCNQLGLAFKHILITTPEPHRIWTANWSRDQIAQLRNSFNSDLLQGLQRHDIHAILMPLERILAEGALNLWHMKQCEEKKVKYTRTGPERPLAIKKAPKPKKTPTHQSQPSPWPARPTTSKRQRRHHRASNNRVQVSTTIQLLQFPLPTTDALRQLRQACRIDKSGDIAVRIQTSTGPFPITGQEMQRISDANGHYHNEGLFNDNIIAAYLALVQDAYSESVKIACLSASTSLLNRNFSDVLRQLRYAPSRRSTGQFGDQKWIFFVFHIAGGKGHWVALGINTQNKCFTYYDYAKMNTNRTECMSATRAFLQHMDTITSNTVPWIENPEGTLDMDQQLNDKDCGPGTCLIIDAIAQGLSLSSLSRAAINQGRQHIAMCLLNQRILPLRDMLVTTVTSTTSDLLSTQRPHTSLNPDGTPTTPPLCLTSQHDTSPITSIASQTLIHLHDTQPHLIHTLSHPHLEIPSLSPDNQQDIDDYIISPPPLPMDSLQDSVFHSDILDLIKPDSIAHTVVDRTMHDVLRGRHDVTYIPIALTLAISALPDQPEAAAQAIMTQQEWNHLKNILFTTRYTVIGLHTSDPHFVGAILDLRPFNAASPTFYFLDSLLLDNHAAKLLRITQSIFIHVSNNCHIPHPSTWTIDTTATRYMTPQQPYSPPGRPQSEATHIECGVYVIMMVQMWLADQPLSAITPISVQQYRFHIAHHLIQSTNNIQLNQWITPTAPLGSNSSLYELPATISSDSTSLTDIDLSTATLFDCTHLTNHKAKHLRPRKQTASFCPTVLPPSRSRHHFQINDPASLYTYASESTLPNAGWGLFADRLVGPDSPLDQGHLVGEYFGRILSAEDIKSYILDPNPSVNTGFMIFFQGLAIDAWDHANGTYICMTALTNDCLDDKRYNTEWVKKTTNGRTSLYQEANHNVQANAEFFVEYGNLAFCRANFPTDILFKAISHYYSQIAVSAHDRELWSRIPQARYLFNSPYHTLQPSQIPKAIMLLEYHHSNCDIRCICDLQQQLTLIHTPTSNKKRPHSRLTIPSKRPKRSHTVIPIPDSNNSRYDERLIVKPDTTLPDAGLGLFAIASIKTGDIIGIYENYNGGQRLTSNRILRPSHKSAYAVEHNGLVRDAWNPELNQPCCKLAYSNDAMDSTKDNATLGVNSNFPMTLLFIATKDINADPTNELPINLPYGGKYWCDDKYPIELHAQAIRRYQINIYTSTEDTDGDWTALRNFPQLSQIFPPSFYTPSPRTMTGSHVNHSLDTILPTGGTSETTQAITAPSKKRLPQKSRVIKDARQKTMDAYISRRTLAEDATAGVCISTCHVLSDLDVLPAAMKSNPLYIEILPSPPPAVNSSSIANSTTTSHSRDEPLPPTIEHDKRDVYI
jgi:hypothetical protein